ncbi:RsfS/YbeB/iojap family protein, partial [Blautia wexlerae]|uniref:RsfS/YbeB/iojap family protein n=1 Tax=Blautia wexlerae TaxID=418240 RepID=UPI0034A1DC2D
MNRELEMAKLACHALDEKKGKDIKVIDIHEVSVIADYFVIASASNQNQVQACLLYTSPGPRDYRVSRMASS